LLIGDIFVRFDLAELMKRLDELRRGATSRVDPFWDFIPRSGRPRTVDWDVLFVLLARLYSEAGGRVSLKPTSRFMRFVGVLRSALPREAQGASIATLAQTARKGQLTPRYQAMLNNIRGG
jgi:hypothetical protein